MIYLTASDGNSLDLSFFLSWRILSLVAVDLVSAGESAALCGSLVPAARPGVVADLQFSLLAAGSGVVQPGGPLSSARQHGQRHVQGKHQH